MDVEQFKEDVRQGRIDRDRLADLLVSALRQLEEAKRRIQELEEQLKQLPTVKLEEPYSVAAEEKRQAARGKKTRKPKRVRQYDTNLSQDAGLLPPVGSHRSSDDCSDK